MKPDKIRTTTIVCCMVNGYHVSLRRHRSVERNSRVSVTFMLCFVLGKYGLYKRRTGRTGQCMNHAPAFIRSWAVRRRVLFINILDSLTVLCLVYNTAMLYTVYGRCGQHGRCMVHTLAGAAGAWFIQTVLIKYETTEKWQKLEFRSTLRWRLNDTW